MRRELRVIRGLSWQERRLLARSWLLLLLVDAGLRVLPLARVQRALKAGARVPHDARPALARVTAERVLWLVGAAARHHLYPMRCLRRSLVAQRILRGHGMATELRLGIRLENGRLHAHAWLERDGEAVGEPAGAAGFYAPLSAPGASA